MKRTGWLTIFLLGLGDLCIMYAGLFLVLALRSPENFWNEFLYHHALPFSIMFAAALLIFYIAGLYSIRRLRNSLEFFKTLFLTYFTILVIAVLFFYFVPTIAGIAPKTNLFLYMGFFIILETAMRRFFNRLIALSASKIRLVLLGRNQAEKEIELAVAESPQLGYEIVHRIENETIFPEEIAAFVHQYKPDMVIVPHHLKKNSGVARVFYELLISGVVVQDSTLFFETLLKRIPVAELEEEWFLEHLANHERFYDSLKRAMEFFFACVLGIVLIPLVALIALLIVLTSRGPMLIRQTRVGRDGTLFTLLKFRSMVALAANGFAETNGAQWSSGNDTRVTPLGRLLRASHLDELPQLGNIIRGDLSFVGPRPERPEFVEMLKKEVPFYETRHLILPGVTGWAQLNYRYGSSVEDAVKKLEYDLYYLKNRSLVLDAAIVLRTLKLFFVQNE
jgi:exopolysaccharide biosynthesis polyprenyl glycosylphosphotransferase